MQLSISKTSPVQVAKYSAVTEWCFASCSSALLFALCLCPPPVMLLQRCFRSANSAWAQKYTQTESKSRGPKDTAEQGHLWKRDRA